MLNDYIDYFCYNKGGTEKKKRLFVNTYMKVITLLYLLCGIITVSLMVFFVFDFHGYFYGLEGADLVGNDVNRVVYSYFGFIVMFLVIVVSMFNGVAGIMFLQCYKGGKTAKLIWTIYFVNSLLFPFLSTFVYFGFGMIYFIGMRTFTLNGTVFWGFANSSIVSLLSFFIGIIFAVFGFSAIWFTLKKWRYETKNIDPSSVVVKMGCNMGDRSTYIVVLILVMVNIGGMGIWLILSFINKFGMLFVLVNNDDRNFFWLSFMMLLLNFFIFGVSVFSGLVYGVCGVCPKKNDRKKMLYIFFISTIIVTFLLFVMFLFDWINQTDSVPFNQWFPLRRGSVVFFGIFFSFFYFWAVLFIGIVILMKKKKVTKVDINSPYDNINDGVDVEEEQHSLEKPVSYRNVKEDIPQEDGIAEIQEEPQFNDPPLEDISIPNGEQEIQETVITEKFDDIAAQAINQV